MIKVGDYIHDVKFEDEENPIPDDETVLNIAIITEDTSGTCRTYSLAREDAYQDLMFVAIEITKPQVK